LVGELIARPDYTPAWPMPTRSGVPAAGYWPMCCAISFEPFHRLASLSRLR